MTSIPFAVVLAGHLLGDWVVQTDAQAAAKASCWWANQRHMVSYHLTLWVAFCLWCLLSGAPYADLVADMYIILVLSWTSHSFIDRRWPVAWLMRHTGSAPFSRTSWGPVCVDQALHISILGFCVAALS